MALAVDWAVKPHTNKTKFGAHHALMKELASEDSYSFRNFIRMDKQDFDELLTKETPFIQKQDIKMRESITPADSIVQRDCL